MGVTCVRIGFTGTGESVAVFGAVGRMGGERVLTLRYQVRIWEKVHLVNGSMRGCRQGSTGLREQDRGGNINKETGIENVHNGRGTRAGESNVHTR